MVWRQARMPSLACNAVDSVHVDGSTTSTLMEADRVFLSIHTTEKRMQASTKSYPEYKHSPHSREGMETNCDAGAPAKGFSSRRPKSIIPELSGELLSNSI